MRLQWPILLLWLVMGASGAPGIANDVAGETAPAKPVVNQLSPQEQALFDAVKTGDKEKVKKLIADGVDVNCRYSPEGETPLVAAIEYELKTEPGYREMPQLLIEGGADIHEPVRCFRYLNGWSCTLSHPIRVFQFALLQDYPSAKVVSSLLDAGADVNQTFKKVEAVCTPCSSGQKYSGIRPRVLRMEESSPLIAVLSKFSPRGNNPSFSKANGAVAICLIEHDADMTATSKNHETALQLAISSQYCRATMLMIERGILDHMKPEQKQMAFNMAVFRGFVPMMKVLQDDGITLSETHNRLLGLAIERCKLDGIRILLEMGASPAPEHFGNCSLEPPIVEVMTCGRYTVSEPLSYLRKTIQALLDYGADINQSNCKGQYPLGIAISMRHNNIQQNVDQIEMILNMGADVNRFQGRGPNPLALAIQRKSKKVVELLLAHGADPAKPIRDYYGTTDAPLNLIGGHVSHMIPNQDRKMLTPVELAQKLGVQDIVDLLKQQIKIARGDF